MHLLLDDRQIDRIRDILRAIGRVLHRQFIHLHLRLIAILRTVKLLRQPVQFLDGVRPAEVVTGPVLFGLLFLEVVLNELPEQESSRRGGSGRRL